MYPIQGCGQIRLNGGGCTAVGIEGIRPVVSLNSNIEIIGKDNNGVWQYR